MRAILINPVTRAVTPIDVTSGFDSERGLYAHMKAADPGFTSNMVELVRLSASPRLDLWIDEEGALTDGREVWKLAGSDQHFAGAAILLAADEEGNSTDCFIPAYRVAQVVEWTNLETTGDFGPSREYEAESEMLGKHWVYEGGKAIYRERTIEG
jgi:hypothetical protein